MRFLWASGFVFLPCSVDRASLLESREERKFSPHVWDLRLRVIHAQLLGVVIRGDIITINFR